MTRPAAPSEIGGPDPLDERLDASPEGRRLRLPVWSTALGLPPLVAPTLLFVPLGLLLGPAGVGLVSRAALSHLDAVVSVALAALGVFVGLGLKLGEKADRRLLLAASVESTVTIVMVALAAGFLLFHWRLPLDTAPEIVALALGVCAAASASIAAGAAGGGEASRIADLDDVLPIVIGAFLVASARGTGGGSVGGLALTVLIGLAAGAAGELLFERAASPAERGVFVLGTVVFLGGAAAHLSLSPLLAGLAAGAFWTHAAGRSDEVIGADLRKFQHPLVVLLLLSAGASLEAGRLAAWLAVPFVVFRLWGKLAGGWAAARLTPSLRTLDLGAHLLPPGVLGIAFALNFDQVAASSASQAVLFAVAAGSLVCEVMALAVGPAPERRT